MPKKRIIGLDIETLGGTNPYMDGAHIWVICWYGAKKKDRGKWVVIEDIHAEEVKYTQAPQELLDIISDPNVVLVGHNIAAFDTFWMEAWAEFGETPGFVPKNVNEETIIKCSLFDTLVAQSLIDENSPNKLNDLGSRYLKETKTEDIDASKLYLYPEGDVVAYCYQDAKLSYKLYKILKQKLKDNDQLALFNFQMLVVWDIIAIQRRGMQVDVEYLTKITKKYESILVKLKQDMIDIIGQDFNPNSSKQLVEIFYDFLQLPQLPGKYGTTKAGKPSCSAQTVTQLIHRRSHWENEFDVDYSDAVPFLELLLEYRKIHKSLSTYFRNLSEKYLCIDNRVRPRFYLGKGSDNYTKSVFGTTTGRLSSRDPNLQNVSNNPDIKRCFVASGGHRMFSVDYSQLEVRVAGYVAQDANMLRAFRDNLDLHTLTLTYVYGKSYEFILKKLNKGSPRWKSRRKLIKPFNFGLIYGASEYTLQDTLLNQQHVWVPLEEIKHIAEKWKSIYSDYVNYQNLILQIIKEEHEITTFTWRRRRFPLLANPQVPYRDVQTMHRQAVNSTIQGLASDITMFALRDINRFLIDNQFGSLLATVHDSLEGEFIPSRISEGELERVILDFMRQSPHKYLQEFFDLDTTDLFLDAEIEFSQNWAGEN